MDKHMNIKHKVKGIQRRSLFNEILEDSMLSEKEKKMLTMYYLENKPLNYIADELGYSEAGIKKMHKRSLQKIEALL